MSTLGCTSSCLLDRIGAVITTYTGSVISAISDVNLLFLSVELLCQAIISQEARS